MNIAFDAKRITQNATGLGNYSRFIVNALAEYSPENNYLLCSPSVGQRSLYSNLLNYRSVSLHTPTNATSLLFPTLWRNFGVRGLLKEKRVDIYHGLSNELPIGLYHSDAMATVLTLHDLAFVRYPQFYKPMDRLLYRKKYGASARSADHVIAVSEMTRKDAIEVFGVEEDRISVVYQGCAPRFSMVRPELVAFVRGHYQLPERYILFVGSIEERKNLKLVVQAMSMLHDQSLHLIAIGKRTPYADQVMAEATKLRLSGRVHLMHGVPDEHLPGLYAGADLFVYPSKFEGFGIPVIEALNAGVPVIGATGSCLEEAGGPDSLYTDPEDAHMLCAQMEQILSSEELTQRMIERGKVYVQRFLPKQIVRDLRAIYENVMVNY